LTMADITAKQAKAAADAILEGNGGKPWAKKMSEYLGEWNTLGLYLEAQVRKEEATK